MKTLKLIRLAIACHWNAQRSNPVNMMAAVFGMVINNSIVLFGLWAMLFSGKPDGHQMTLYFLILNSIVTMAWGSVCFFLGGFYSLAEYVEEGNLEPMLSAPRHPLLLVGISQSVLPSLGDLVQGLCTLSVVFYLGGTAVGVRCILMILASTVASMATFILTGSIPFFVSRGGQLAHLIREISLSLSFYPTGKVFDDRLKWILWATPAAAIALFPMQAIEFWTIINIAIAAIAACTLLGLSISVFQLGLKRYQSASYVTART